MPDIQYLIKMLHSNNPNKRYDACEELRVSPWLPPEAIEALQTITSDPNPEVADAAQRAIKLHTSGEANYNIYEDSLQINKSDNLPATRIILPILAGAIGGFLATLLIVGLLIGDFFSMEALLYSPVVFDPFSFSLFRILMGGALGYIILQIYKHKNVKEVILRAFFAGLLGTGMVTFCAIIAFAQ